MRYLSILFLSISIFIWSPGSEAAGFKNETLHYVISYKWGLIHKDAGEATLSLRDNGSVYSLVLSAKTKPWADRFYQVRDTLLGSVNKNGFRPLSYSKIAHEKGRYARDDIKYHYTSSSVKGETKLTRRNKEGETTVRNKTIFGSGPVFDMLSVFYYLRLVNYDNLERGEAMKATVFSGSKSETITIKCLGKEIIELKNKKKRLAYHIKFNFTQEGKKKSSDDIDTWISADSAHIPLYLVGKLPVGQVRAYYIP